MCGLFFFPMPFYLPEDSGLKKEVLRSNKYPQNNKRKGKQIISSRMIFKKLL